MRLAGPFPTATIPNRFLTLWPMVVFLAAQSASSAWAQSDLSQDSADIDQHMAKKKVHMFLGAMEGVEDYQLEYFTKNMYQFFYEYQRLSDLRHFHRSEKDSDRKKKNRAINRANEQIAKLHFTTRKNLKQILDKKQHKQFTKLIVKVAPLPRSRGNRSYPSDDNWLRTSPDFDDSTYSLQYRDQ